MSDTLLLVNCPAYLDLDGLRAVFEDAMANVLFAEVNPWGKCAFVRLSGDDDCAPFLSGEKTLHIGTTHVRVLPSPVEIPPSFYKRSRGADQAPASDFAFALPDTNVNNGETICRACGSTDHVSKNCTGGRTQSTPAKQRRTENSTGDNACKKCGSTDHLTRHCTGASPEATSIPKAHGDGCKKCGSTDHLTRNCTGKAAAYVPMTTASAVVSGDACKKCGSTSHLTRHCTGAKPSAVPVATEAPRQVAGEQRSPVARDGPRDACKKCGSTDHLTRHCTPSKPSTYTPMTTAVTPAISAPVVTGDGCKKCGSAEHLTRQCKGPVVAAVTTAAPVVLSADPPRATGGDGCKKCGATSHLTRHCTQGKPAVRETPVATEPVRTSAATNPVTDGVMAATQGDGCKKCGATSHLTRHCTQGKHVALETPAGTVPPDRVASQAVAPTSDACKKCGSGSHLTRHCTARK